MKLVHVKRLNNLISLVKIGFFLAFFSLLMSRQVSAQVDVLTDNTSLSSASGYSSGPPATLTLGNTSLVFFQVGDADTSWNFVVNNQQSYYSTTIQGSGNNSTSNTAARQISAISLQTGNYTITSDLTGSTFTLGSAGNNTYVGLTLQGMDFIFGNNSTPLNAASYSLQSQQVFTFNGGGSQQTVGSTLDLNGVPGNLQMTTLSGNSAAVVKNNGTAGNIEIQNSCTYSGIVSGNIELTIGSGSSPGSTITFNGTGVSNYNGGLTINLNDTFIVNGDNNLGSGSVQMGSGSALIFTGTDGQQTTTKTITLNGSNELGAGSGTTATFNGQITGTGPLTINDATYTGTVILGNNTNNYTGGTTITNGILQINAAGALSTGGLTLNGGTAGNTTTLQSFNVASLTQSAGNLYLYLASANLTTPVVNITGTAIITGGSLTLDFSGANTAAKGQVYDLIHAGGGIIGTYGANVSVTNLDPTLKATVTYDPIPSATDVHANVSLSQLPFTGAAGVSSPSQTAIAGYIDQFSTTVTTGPFATLVAGLNSVSSDPNALGGALDQLSPLKFESFTSSNAFNNASFFTQQFDNYLAGLRSGEGIFTTSAGGFGTSGLVYNDPSYAPGLQAVHSRLAQMGTPFIRDAQNPQYGSSVAGVTYDSKAMLTPDISHQWNTFISGNVVLAQNFSDPSAGLAHSDTTSEAVQFGVDYLFTPHFLIGATFGYGHTGADLDNLGSTAKVDTYSPGLYAAYTDGGWYANALASYGFSDYTYHRQVVIGGFGGTAASSPSGSQVIGNVDGGYDFHQGLWTFGPTAGVQYTHLEVNSFTETGLPGADLNVADNQSDSLRSLLGGHLSYDVQAGSVTLTPHASASWQHEFLDQSRGITSQFSDIGSSSFVVKTSSPSRDSALVDLGLNARVCDSVTLFGDYSVQAGQENYFGQSIEAGVKVGF